MELSQRSNRFSTEDSHQTLDLEIEFENDLALHEQLEQPQVNPNEQNNITRSNASPNNHKKKREKSNLIRNLINVDKKLLSM
jgi:hypothetical protein